ncbi:MAG: ribonuclease E/G [Pseudomonadota bacterium]
MKGRLIALGHAPSGARAAALIVDGVLEDYIEDAPEGDETPPVGEILPARILRTGGKSAGLGPGGAFVSLPNGGQGFLRDGAGLKEGRRLLVQVAGYAEPGKAPPVTRRLSYRCPLLVHTPGAPGLNVSRQIRSEDERTRLEDALRAAADPFFQATRPADGEDSPAARRHALMARYGEMLEDGGIIVRSAAEDASPAALAAALQALLERRDALERMVSAGEAPPRAETAHAIALREWCVPQPAAIIAGDAAVFDWAEATIPAPLLPRLSQEDGADFDGLGVLDALDALASRNWALPSGGSLVIEATTALTAVDVNTGGDFSPAAGLKANIEAARALPRQLRLRGLGGQVVVDFAPMPQKDRRAVESAIKAAFKRDPIDTTAHGFTTMGLYELQRKRERRPLNGLR